MKKNRAVFLDRDGTINEEVGYLGNLEQLRIFPAAFDAVRMINEAGMKVVVVTNQSGVARGFFDEDFVNAVHARTNELFRAQGAFIDRFYYCPHHPTEGIGKYRISCDCRKPAPGMLIKASEELDIDLPGSYVVGDMAKDIELANNVGAGGILVRTGYGKKVKASDIKAACIARDILDATEWIMKDMKN
ncbi:MAG: D-glycero-beta-D-manno-heptose 1,7-bisphosphate 7-phosphatase [Syntrophobacterales bacterium]|nr:D-glycero-beta-D-manno-heptose 1,7-bisphosphate 7-phosphatase [Syntrophobacterales bacterium]